MWLSKYEVRKMRWAVSRELGCGEASNQEATSMTANVSAAHIVAELSPRINIAS